MIFLLDCSGSMRADGKMQALNTALREALPHLSAFEASAPHIDLLVRVIAFGTGARWHLAEPVSPRDLHWSDLEAHGYTDLGEALDLLAAALTVPPMERRAFPPALVLISDGMPTDDYLPALDRLLALPWGERSVRLAVGIGRDADHEALVAFQGVAAREPLLANNPEQLIEAIRWASTQVSRAASTMRNSLQGSEASRTPRLDDITGGEPVW